MAVTRGGVFDGEPVARIVLVGPGGSRTITAVVDTGMGDAINLPWDFFESFRLGSSRVGATIVADGREVDHPTARFLVRLAGRTIRVWGDCLGEEVLIGMDLLQGHRLTVDCTEGGPVLIEPLNDLPTES